MPLQSFRYSMLIILLVALSNSCASTPSRDRSWLTGKLRSINLGPGWKEKTVEDEKTAFAAVRSPDVGAQDKSKSVLLVTDMNGADAMRAYGYITQGGTLRSWKGVQKMNESGQHCTEFIFDKSLPSRTYDYAFSCLRSSRFLLYVQDGGISPPPEATKRIQEVLAEEIALD